MFFVNINSINLVANSLGYIQSDDNFDIMLDKQKLLSHGFNYFDVDENNVKKASIYMPYEHFESIGFTFKHSTNNAT